MTRDPMRLKFRSCSINCTYINSDPPNFYTYDTEEGEGVERVLALFDDDSLRQLSHLLGTMAAKAASEVERRRQCQQ